MALFFLLILCLTITGQINVQGHESTGPGLQSALTQFIHDDPHEIYESEKSEDHPLKSGVGKDVDPKKGENVKSFEEEQEAENLKPKTKVTTKAVVQLKQDMKVDKVGKSEMDTNAKPKPSLDTLTKSKKIDSSKVNRDSEKNKTETKGHKKENHLQEGQFKQISLHKQDPHHGLNEIQRLGSVKLHANLKSKNSFEHNKNHKVMPSGQKADIHHPMKKNQSKSVAKKANDKKNRDLPNGGKVVFAKLPDSLLMKGVPKLFPHKDQLKTKGNYQKEKRKPFMKNPNHKKPVKNNQKNPMVIKKVWKVVKG